MECPVCHALKVEHNHECQVEAAAVLKQREELIGSYKKRGSAKQGDLEKVILNSRKRQIEIVSKIEVHKAKGHAA